MEKILFERIKLISMGIKNIEIIRTGLIRIGLEKRISYFKGFLGNIFCWKLERIRKD